jgi:hypothetical protein
MVMFCTLTTRPNATGCAPMDWEVETDEALGGLASRDAGQAE